MIGFEILVNVPREKRQEFLQTCKMLHDPKNPDPDCQRHALFENINQPNQFLWMEHWKVRKSVEAHLNSRKFGILMGAISVLGETNQILRLEAEKVDG